jgi:hypothetical protein
LKGKRLTINYVNEFGEKCILTEPPTLVGNTAENEWDYDVSERVTNAVGCLQTRDGDLGTLMHLRYTLNDLMDQVNPAELTVPELVGMIAILAPANGRKLITETLAKALRPILRLVDESIDLENPAAHLGEQDADLLDDVIGGDTIKPVG